MKVTNKTAYATIGCDVQLTENDRLALGIELDKVTNWLETVIGDESEVAESLKAVNKIVAFVSKFAIRPSETNVFTDSPEDFERIDKIVVPDSIADETVDTDEPASTDDVISVRIADFKKVAKLTMIIHRASDASIARIKYILNSAEVKCVPCISFRCTYKHKEEVVNELIDAGYQVVPNDLNQSLRL